MPRTPPIESIFGGPKPRAILTSNILDPPLQTVYNYNYAINTKCVVITKQMLHKHLKISTITTTNRSSNVRVT